MRLREKVLGEEHPNTLMSMNNLANLYAEESNFKDAESLFIRCLQLRKKVLGQEHPDTLTTSHNFAIMYRNDGQYEKAAILYKECWQIQQNVWGKDHPNTHRAMYNLALLYEKQQKYEEAQKLILQRLQYSNLFFHNLFLGSDKSVQTNFLLDEESCNNFFLNLNVKTNNENSAHNMVYFSLTRKGFLLSASMHLHQLIQKNSSPEIDKTFLEWKIVQQQLAHLLLNQPKAQMRSTNKQEELRKQLEHLERQLGSQSKKFSQQNHEIKVEDLQSRLDKNEVVVDIMIFTKVESEEEYRYVIASIIRHNKLTLVPIGRYLPISKALDEFLATMSSHKKSLYHKKLAQRLYSLIWQPLLKNIGDVKNITIVPDAELHMLPFAVLCDSEGKYLIENTHIQTTSSLRNLVIAKKNKPQQQDVVIFANPDYNKRTDNSPKLGLSFSELPGTKIESAHLQKLLHQKQISYQVYEDKNANKTNLLALKNPRILHLATHGFFRPVPKIVQNERGIDTPEEWLEPVVENIPQFFSDPLAYCGLAFTGANTSSSLNTILLGSEIPALQLTQTELVVLSACETGKGTTERLTSEGDIYYAEEVFSLKRAFEEAGAKAILATMWGASDKATQKFMTQFYQYYLDKIPPQQAIRTVQLEFLHSEKYAHPYYWANFVLTGYDKDFPNHTNMVDMQISKKTRFSRTNVILLLLVSTIVFVMIYTFLRLKKVQKRSKMPRQTRRKR